MYADVTLSTAALTDCVINAIMTPHSLILLLFVVASILFLCCFMKPFGRWLRSVCGIFNKPQVQMNGSKPHHVSSVGASIPGAARSAGPNDRHPAASERYGAFNPDTIRPCVISHSVLNPSAGSCANRPIISTGTGNPN